MSGLRGLIPATVAIGLGIFTGYYTFHPAIQQFNAERQINNQSERPVGKGSDKESSPGTTASQERDSVEKNPPTSKPGDAR